MNYGYIYIAMIDSIDLAPPLELLGPSSGKLNNRMNFFHLLYSIAFTAGNFPWSDYIYV